MSGGAGYFVHVAERVEVYSHAIDVLSEERRQQILNACLLDLARNADHFLKRYPLQHESYSFQYEYAFVEGDRVYSFRFIADGSHMATGIVQVIYVDHETLSRSS